MARNPKPSSPEPGGAPPIDGDWDDIYRGARPEQLPWFTPHLDPDFDAAFRKLKVRTDAGPILDLGTGPGTVAIELARRGFQVCAVDISPNAIELAQRRAAGLSTRIEWVARDLFDCHWPGRFQLISDRGVYHSLPRETRRRYPAKVLPWLQPGGHLVLKAFSPDEPGDWGPNRIPRDELEAAFAPHVRELRASTFPGGLDHEPRCWFMTVQARAALALRKGQV